MTSIYKVLSKGAWTEAQASGVFRGAPVDIADGFIHFSTGAQVAETVAKHFAGHADLIVLTVDAATLGAALKWEESRGGALFPHLYAPLALSHVLDARPLPLGVDGRHDFTGLLP